MDKNDEKMMVSIEQMKGSMKQIEENNQNAKTVTINGHSGNLIKCLCFPRVSFDF
jgi:hypothetical protein